jgi:hypothetical protein
LWFRRLFKPRYEQCRLRAEGDGVFLRLTSRGANGDAMWADGKLHTERGGPLKPAIDANDRFG